MAHLRNCDDYVEELMRLCDSITRECSGLTFAQLGLKGDSENELRKGWVHFVRLVCLRDYEWENVMKRLSEPADAANEFSQKGAVAKMVQKAIRDKLLVPLQLWEYLLRVSSGAASPVKKVGYV